MNARSRGYGAVVLLLLGGGAFWNCRRESEPARLQAAGSVEARNVHVGSLIGGRVAAVHVKEGDLLAAAAPIVTLESDLIDLQIAQQKRQIAQSEAQLRLLQRGPRAEELRRARLDYENAERDRARFEKLFADGIVGKQQLDAATTAANWRKQLVTQLESGSRPEEIEAARQGMERERARLDYLERQKRELIVVAPAAGIVQSIDLRPGDLVAPNQAVAELIEPDQLWVRVFVPETRLGLVRLGQAVDLTVDSFPGRSFAGKVVEISQRGEYTPRNLQTIEQRNDQVFGVKIEIAPTPELKPGMTVIAGFHDATLPAH